MTNVENVREIREAIDAADRALVSLGEAREALDSAKNWGIFDMIGGGFFSSMIKHGRMEDASAAMERAKDDLYRLQAELRDIDVPADFQVDVGGFLSFADVFFDNLFVDWMVQSRINDARDQVMEATARVQMILADLREWEQRLLKG